MGFEDDEYLKRLDDYLENGGPTTMRKELTEGGFNLIPSENVSDDELHQVLTELVWALEGERVFVEDADHLTDRELYEELLSMCDDPTFSLADLEEDAACHWSLIDAGGEDNWLRFYADENDRKWVLDEDPDTILPPSELPPYPRPWIPVR